MLSVRGIGVSVDKTRNQVTKKVMYGNTIFGESKEKDVVKELKRFFCQRIARFACRSVPAPWEASVDSGYTALFLSNVPLSGLSFDQINLKQPGSRLLFLDVVVWQKRFKGEDVQ